MPTEPSQCFSAWPNLAWEVSSPVVLRRDHDCYFQMLLPPDVITYFVPSCQAIFGNLGLVICSSTWAVEFQIWCLCIHRIYALLWQSPNWCWNWFGFCSFQKISQAWLCSIQDSTIPSVLILRRMISGRSFFTLKYFPVKHEAWSGRSGLLRITHYCSELPRKVEG